MKPTTSTQDIINTANTSATNASATNTSATNASATVITKDTYMLVIKDFIDAAKAKQMLFDAFRPTVHAMFKTLVEDWSESYIDLLMDVYNATHDWPSYNTMMYASVVSARSIEQGRRSADGEITYWKNTYENALAERKVAADELHATISRMQATIEDMGRRLGSASAPSTSASVSASVPSTSVSASIDTSASTSSSVSVASSASSMSNVIVDRDEPIDKYKLANETFDLFMQNNSEIELLRKEKKALKKQLKKFQKQVLKTPPKAVAGSSARAPAPPKPKKQ